MTPGASRSQADSGISSHAGNTKLLKHGICFGSEPTEMARLARDTGLRPGNEISEKDFRDAPIELKLRWELDKEHGELVPQSPGLSEEFGDLRRTIDQLLLMGDLLRHFNGKS